MKVSETIYWTNGITLGMITSVRNGVNVIIWFSIDLVKDNETGDAYIGRGPDMACVAKIVHQIRQEGFHEVVHLIAVGGWNRFFFC